MVAFGLVHTPMAAAPAPRCSPSGALTFAVLGMAYTALVGNIEHFNILFTGVLTPMFLFGGVFFPFVELPDWAQVVGWCLPLSHLVAATRDLTLGDAGPLHAGARRGAAGPAWWCSSRSPRAPESDSCADVPPADPVGRSAHDAPGREHRLTMSRRPRW